MGPVNIGQGSVQRYFIMIKTIIPSGLPCNINTGMNIAGSVPVL
ncbi:hypothetical protein MGWOODY_Clf471 [hydrothermal vent metagenome]|uniref:Uncharacterized protein n=2 Tax=ecological metagenomes TaxID=410657 RepID=A0A160VAJ6_9ZZZZ